eukprot:754810-Hanusia_phi.AAC.3
MNDRQAGVVISQTARVGVSQRKGNCAGVRIARGRGEGRGSLDGRSRGVLVAGGDTRVGGSGGWLSERRIRHARSGRRLEGQSGGDLSISPENSHNLPGTMKWSKRNMLSLMIEAINENATKPCTRNTYMQTCSAICDMVKNCSGNGRCNGQTG